MSQLATTTLQIALDAFPAWNQIGTDKRAEQLTLAFQSLSPAQQKMAFWQLNNAQKTIAKPQIMAGPTGEKNTLIAQGRGVFLVSLAEALHFSDDEKITIALIGQIAAALVAGNTIITTGKAAQNITTCMTPLLAKGVIQHIKPSELAELLANEAIAGLVTLCDESEAIRLQRSLASKSGLICQLIAETDHQTFSRISKPSYILNFITEQTLSNNTTAIGGNANLLELGSLAD